MKNLAILLSTLFLLTSFTAPTASLQGVWNTGKENTKIKTYQKDGKWYVHPCPTIDSLLSAGLNEEKDSIDDFTKKYTIKNNK